MLKWQSGKSIQSASWKDRWIVAIMRGLRSLTAKGCLLHKRQSKKHIICSWTVMCWNSLIHQRLEVIEIGKDFTFIGNEYRVQVGNHDYYIDLLFYHRGLSCLAAFELKLGEFKPEYIGKMNLYLEALDREVKEKAENPSVGVILCTSKDDKVVEYTLSRSLSPAMVSEYTLKLIDKSLLQRKLKEYAEIAEEESE